MSIDTLEATRARWAACQSRLADIETRLGDITGVCTDAFTNCDQIESMLANRKLANVTLEADARRLNWLEAQASESPIHIGRAVTLTGRRLLADQPNLRAAIDMSMKGSNATS